MITTAVIQAALLPSNLDTLGLLARHKWKEYQCGSRRFLSPVNLCQTKLVEFSISHANRKKSVSYKLALALAWVAGKRDSSKFKS
jgi:hypothetical protein